MNQNKFFIVIKSKSFCAHFFFHSIFISSWNLLCHITVMKLLPLPHTHPVRLNDLRGLF